MADPARLIGSTFERFAMLLFLFAVFARQRGENHFPISDVTTEECSNTIPINSAPAVWAIAY
jgi:hypothetical protein